jgi:excisionase family DNA binding protein
MSQERLLITVKDAARALSLSRSMVFKLVRAGRLHSVLIGRSRRIPAESLAALVATLLNQVAP